MKTIKINKKVVIFVSIMLSAVILVGFAAQGTKGNGVSGNVSTLILQKGDLTYSVSTTGTIYSQNVTKVYSNLNYQVKEIYVDVGDVVKAGDTLARLDVASLEKDIAQKRAALNNTQASTQLALEIAQNDLDIYLENLEENLNAELYNAGISVETARLDLQAAQSDVKNARRNLSDAEDSGADDDELDQLKEISVQKEIVLDKAQANLDKATKAYEIAQANKNTTVSSYENKVRSAEISANLQDQLIALQKLESDLASSTIKAPVSGTISDVQAVAGASGNGLLFVIQDTDNLKVITNIPEYDVATVQVGNRVTIKTDATGDKVFEGVLSRISPTSTESIAGKTNTSTDAEFESEITVASSASGLRIGMNARLNTIIEEKSNIYSVPYETLGTTPEGENYIYVAIPNGTDHIVQKLSVTIGLESNLFAEILSDSLTDGMIVIKNPQNVKQGDKITLQK